jgi:hypothetical protein
MAKFRVLWVHSQERKLKCGEVYDEADIRKAGYEPEHMVAAGDAEAMASAPPKAAAKKEG